MDDLKAILAGSTARDDKGRFSSVTPTESTPEPVAAAPIEPVKTEPVKVETAPVTQPVEPQPGFVPKKALIVEREKRQAAEAELRELRTPKADQVDYWNDLSGAFTAQEKKFDEKLFLERCNLTEEAARDKYKDYEDVRELFAQAAEENYALAVQLRNARNPAQFAYQEGLKIREWSEVGGDLSAYRLKIEKETEARLEAKHAAHTAPVPASLNSDGSPAAASEVYQGPPPLREILRNKR